MATIANVESVPTKQDFAREVRADRLSLLWKVTMALTFAAIWLALIFSALSTPALGHVIGPSLLVLVGCVGTNLLLQRHSYEYAVYSYALGLLFAVALLILPQGDLSSREAIRDVFGFALPVIVLIVGLLLPFRLTVPFIVIALVIAILVPSLGRPFTFEPYQVFLVFLILVAAGVAAQISGEVYGIAEWALESYSKERKVKEALFDSQEELQRSYVRQKVLAEELQQTNLQLEEARAAAIEAKNFRGQFLANMSHELRTPLNAIIGFSETMLNFPMMYDNQTLPPAYKNDLTQIYTSGRHLLQLINDILDLSKVDAGRLEMELEKVDLEPVFESVLSTASGLVGEKTVEIRRETSSALPPVRGDSLRLRQVILNLLSNASKFTDEGSITLGARDNGNGEVLFWVKDTGIGIPPQDMERIFEEFRQGTSGRRKGRAGSGLGLAISRQLLNLMGGRIWVESTLGAGSTFYFTLPVYTPELVRQER